MFKKNRGTSIAAAALSAALIVPVIAPAANAQTTESSTSETSASETTTSATATTTESTTSAAETTTESTTTETSKATTSTETSKPTTTKEEAPKQVEVKISDVLKQANVKLPEGTTFTVKSGDIEIMDGKIVLKDASKETVDAVIVASLKNRDIRTINVTLTNTAAGLTLSNSNVDNGTCLAAGLGFGLPLLALIPLSISAQFSMPVLAGITEYYNQQIRNLNTEIQRQAGMLNPELAKQVEQIDRTLHAFGWSLGNAAAALAAGVGTAAAIAGIVYYCSPEVFVKAEVKTTTKPEGTGKAENTGAAKPSKESTTVTSKSATSEAASAEASSAESSAQAATTDTTVAEKPAEPTTTGANK